MTQDPGPRERRRRRRKWRSLGGVVFAYVLVTAAGCMNPTSPFDAVLNIAPVDDHPELRGEANTLVVLQHGISRSAWSLWRLERALEHHGYEVLNRSYPSTQQTIQEHAALLERDVERYLAERSGPLPRIAFVGHSMGGLVIRSYLTRERARQPFACVFVATPHQGAHLVTERKELFVFRLFLGSSAILQMEPGHEFLASLGPVPCERIGCIYGGKGDDEGRNDDVPGDDDGTVATTEAQLPEQTDAVRLDQGHTHISFSDEMIRLVLSFLQDGRFDAN